MAIKRKDARFKLGDIDNLLHKVRGHSIGKVALEFFDTALNILYPPRCMLCDGLLTVDDWKRPVCCECSRDIPYIAAETCPVCGQPLEHLEGAACPRCKRQGFAFSKGYSAFRYTDIEASFKYFKFKGCKSYGRQFAALMHEYLRIKNIEMIARADIVTSVPMYPKRRRRRGYNQAEVLARELCWLCGREYTDLLVKIRDTAQQSAQSAVDRKGNVQDAFGVYSDADISGKTIVIIDDVFTTGATINECARVLLMNGAESVGFFTLAAA